MDAQQTKQILKALPIVNKRKRLAEMRQERFEYSKKRLGVLKSLLGDLQEHIEVMGNVTGTVQSVFSQSDLSDMPGHRHALSMEFRQKLIRMFDELNHKTAEIKRQAGITQ